MGVLENNYDEAVEFIKKKIATIGKVSNDILLDIEDPEIAQIMDDMIEDMATIKLQAYIYENTAESRVLTYYCNRPKFTDWLFGRKKKVQFNLEVKDLLINPPNYKDLVHRIYVVSNPIE